MTARLNAIWPAWDACRADPATCDVAALIAEYTTPDSVLAQTWQWTISNYATNHTHTIKLEEIDRFVASVQVTENDATTSVCQRDGAVVVNADGAVVDDEVGFFDFEWLWSKIDGKWMIVGGEHYKIDGIGSVTCDGYFK